MNNWTGFCEVCEQLARGAGHHSNFESMWAEKVHEIKLGASTWRVCEHSYLQTFRIDVEVQREIVSSYSHTFKVDIWKLHLLTHFWSWYMEVARNAYYSKRLLDLTDEVGQVKMKSEIYCDHTHTLIHKCQYQQNYLFRMPPTSSSSSSPSAPSPWAEAWPPYPPVKSCIFFFCSSILPAFSNTLVFFASSAQSQRIRRILLKREEVRNGLVKDVPAVPPVSAAEAVDPRPRGHPAGDGGFQNGASPHSHSPQAVHVPVPQQAAVSRAEWP